MCEGPSHVKMSSCQFLFHWNCRVISQCKEVSVHFGPEPQNNQQNIISKSFLVMVRDAVLPENM